MNAQHTKRTMSLKDAIDLVPDDLPDGAFFAMAHEIAGAEYGEVWSEMDTGRITPPSKKYRCKQCKRKFATTMARDQHTKDAHKCPALAKATS